MATAHAKLRLATHVEVDDIELAGNLLNMTIFNEKPEEEVADADNEEMKEEEQADQDEGAAQQNDDVVPLKQLAGRSARSARRA